MVNTLSKNEVQFYRKQINLEKIGIEGQKRIKQTKVLVIGAGGLGCPILIYLVASGIGHIGILDDDKVEISNLNRQILYRLDNINNYKVIAAKEHLKNINRDCKISIHNYKLSINNRIEIMSYYDIIIDSTDNFITRHIIDETCYKLSKIYIYGAANNFEGQIGIFNYQNGIRYNNLYSLKSGIEDHTCNNTGIIGITTGYIGILQAIETLKLALGLNKNSQDYLHIHRIDNRITKHRYIRLRRNSINTIIIKQNPKNPSKQQQLSIKKYDVTIDVKNQEEFIYEHLKQSINIPLYKLNLHKTIKLLRKYTLYYSLTIYCSNKNKSTLASKILEKNAIENKIR